jgi:hypothetical protein
MDVRSGLGFSAFGDPLSSSASGTDIGSRDRRCLDYIFVIVNEPAPVQPALPVNVHVPEIVLPFAVPESVKSFPEGDPESTEKPKLPFIWPLKFPLRVKEPLSVSPETKHGESVVKLKFEIDKELSPFTFSDVPKVNRACPPLLLVSVAFQVPLMLDGFEFEPQPISVTLATSSAAKTKCFIENISWAKVRSGADSFTDTGRPVAPAL